jgi:hypothetical protein
MNKNNNYFLYKTKKKFNKKKKLNIVNSFDESNIIVTTNKIYHDEKQKLEMQNQIIMNCKLEVIGKRKYENNDKDIQAEEEKLSSIVKENSKKRKTLTKVENKKIEENKNINEIKQNKKKKMKKMKKYLFCNRFY